VRRDSGRVLSPRERPGHLAASRWSENDSEIER